MPDRLRTNADKLSFIISEFAVQRSDINYLKEGQKALNEKMDALDNKLYKSGNGKKAIVAQVEENTEKLKSHLCNAETAEKIKSRRIWDLVIIIISPIVSAIITALVILHNLPH